MASEEIKTRMKEERFLQVYRWYKNDPQISQLPEHGKRLAAVQLAWNSVYEDRWPYTFVKTREVVEKDSEWLEEAASQIEPVQPPPLATTYQRIENLNTGLLKTKRELTRTTKQLKETDKRLGYVEGQTEDNSKELL